MEISNYKILGNLGEGAFSTVMKAQMTDIGSITTGVTISTSQVPFVAIKKLKKKYTNWQDCINLREVKSLKVLSHNNIIKLREVLRENLELFLVFDFCEFNLCQVLPFISSTREMQSIMLQLLLGIGYAHKYGYFHRDIKPENILFCLENNQYVLKVADFGLAREIRSRPPYTEYVSTRWYRAPELLLKYKKYSSPVDIWAIGCILAEMYLQKPLFPGQSELDQLVKICQLIPSEWSEASMLGNLMGFQFPNTTTTINELVIDLNISNFITQCLLFDPVKRPNTTKLLNTALIQDILKLGLEIDSDFQLKGQHLLPALRIRKERTLSCNIVRRSVIESNSQQRTPTVTSQKVPNNLDDLLTSFEQSLKPKSVVDVRKSNCSNLDKSIEEFLKDDSITKSSTVIHSVVEEKPLSNSSFFSIFQRRSKQP